MDTETQPSIRVLHIVSGIALGDQSGGAEQFAVRLAIALAHLDFTTGIYVMGRYDSPAEAIWLDRLEKKHIWICGRTIPVRAGFSVMRNQFLELWSAVTEFRPDIIHAHSERASLFVSLIHLFHPLHPAAVRSVHIEREWITSPYFGWLVDQFITPVGIHTEFAISKMIKEKLDSQIVRRLLRKQSILCPNAIGDEVFEQPKNIDSALPAGIPATHPLIGTVGRLTEQKGYAYLLEAMKIVNQTHSFHLLIVGTGQLDQTLQQLAGEYGIQDSISFLGSRMDVIEILDCLDLFVSSSLWEGLPTVILEAMARQIPVIATDVSGSRELVQDGKTGLLVSPGDANELAKVIRCMLDYPERATEMAQQARQVVRQYRMENIAQSYSHSYLGIVRDI